MGDGMQVCAGVWGEWREVEFGGNLACLLGSRG